MADRALTYEVKLNLSQAKAEAAQLEALFKSELSNIQIVDPLKAQQQFAPVAAQIQATTDRYAKFQTASRAAADAANAASQQAAQGAIQAQNRETSVARSESQLRIIAARAESQERIILARQAATAAAEAEKRTTATVKAELAQQAAAARQAAAQTPTPGAAGATGTSLAGRLGQAALAGVAGYFTIQGAQAIARQAVALDELRTKALRAEVAFKILSGGATSAARNLKAIQDAGGGAIDQLTAMTLGTQLSALGLAKTSDEFGKLTRAARQVALVSPVIHDVQGAISELSLAAANLSFRRLDQLGLTVDDVKGRMESLMAANAGMSDSDAFLAASVDALEAKFGTLLDTTEAGATGLERLRTAWSDFTVTIATSPVGTGTDNIFGWFAEQLDTADTMIKAASGDISAQMESLAADVQQKIRMLSLPQDESIFSFIIPDVDNSQQIAALEQLQAAMDATNAAVAAGVPFADEYQTAVMRAADAILAENDANGAQLSILGAILNWYASTGAAAVAMASDIDQATGAQLALNAAIAGGKLAARGSPGTLAQQLGRAGQTPVPLRGDRRSPLPVDPTLGVRGVLSGANIEGAKINEARKEAEAAAKRGSAAAKKVATAAEKSARDMQSALESIPGLFKESAVTAKQLEDARNGKPQNFADDWLRRLKDEVLNGKDWEGVSIEEAAKRAGIDPNLPAKQILEQFTEAWNNSSLFADKNNLELINAEFVNAQVTAKAELEEKIKQGQQNIFELFGVAADTATQAAAAVASGGGGVSLGGGGGAGLAAGSIGALDASIIPMLDTEGLQAQLDAVALTVKPKLDLSTLITDSFTGIEATKAGLSSALTFAAKPDFSTLITGNFTAISAAKVSLQNAMAFSVTPYIDASLANYETARTFLSERLSFSVTPYIDATLSNFANTSTYLSERLAFTVTPTIDATLSNYETAITYITESLPITLVPWIDYRSVDTATARTFLTETLPLEISPAFDFSNIITNNFEALTAAKTSLSNFMAVSLTPAIDTAAFALQFTGENAPNLAQPLVDAFGLQLANEDISLQLQTMGANAAQYVAWGWNDFDWGSMTGGMISSVLAGASNEKNIALLSGGGKELANAIRGGFQNEANSADWIGDVVNAIIQSILAGLADSVQP